MTIDSSFLFQANTRAQHIAIASGSTYLSYAAVKNFAHACADTILAQAPGIQPIVVCLPRTEPLLYAVLLGVIFSGRAYFYIDPTEPLPIQQALIQHLAAETLIGESKIPVSTHLPLSAFTSTSNELKYNTHILDRCCIVRTSGTSQTSRTVDIRHVDLLHAISNFHHTLQIVPSDRISLLTSPTFCAANSAIFGALLAGATLCPFLLQNKGIHELLAWLRTEEITILHLTPSLFRLLAHYMQPHALPAIRAIKLGGETAYSSDLTLFKTKFKQGTVLVNGLGSSEAAGNIAHFMMDHSTILPDDPRLIPVGHILPGYQVRIVDEQGQQQVCGKVGIIEIQRIETEGYRSIESHDLGYFCNDQQLVHVGRNDRIIKRRGLRVDLNAIEAILLNLPGVRQAAVLFVQDQLIAYVVCTDAEFTKLTAQLAHILPTYMIPQQLIDCVSLPLTNAGKINYRKLDSAHVDRTPPENIKETQILNIWQQVLQRQPISTHDNFFAIGGDSITAMACIAELHQHISSFYSIDLLYRYPTIAELASVDTALQPLRIWIEPYQNKTTLSEQSILFIPGGLMSTTEWQLFNELLPCLHTTHPAFGMQTNFLENSYGAFDTSDIPDKLPDLAALFVTRILRDLGLRKFIFIGECVAGILALEIARQFITNYAVEAQLILLNPWHPHPFKFQQSEEMTSLPYIHLLQCASPTPFPGKIDLICAEERGVLSCQQWWEMHTKTTCHTYKVSGNKHTYIRDHRSALATILRKLL